MTGGLLIQGENYDALHDLNRVDRYKGKVKLAYVDLPWNAGSTSLHETRSHAAWLGMMRKRLRLVRDLLGADGSVWMHVNDRQLADCRLLMDRVIDRSNYVATVNLHNPRRRFDARYLSVDSTYILIFAKELSLWQANRLPRASKPDTSFRNPDNDPRGPWRHNDLTAPMVRPSLQYEVIGPTGTSVTPPPNRSWRFTRQRFEELDRDGRILWRDGIRPTVKRYWSELPDEPPPTVWEPADVGSYLEGRRELRKLLPDGPDCPFAQPERLLHRILTISTMPGDLVLDCFGHAGTTAAVAQKMGRRWITVGSEGYDLRPRLDKVIAGEDPGGITVAVNWRGGGSYDVIAAVPEQDEPAPVPEPTVSLAEAIADGYLRIPVITYREDGRKDLKTRFADACRLRERKEVEWAEGTPPMLFVVCEKRNEIEKVAGILRQDDHLPGERQVVVTGEPVGPLVRAVIGTAEDAASIRDIVVVVSCHELSPNVLSHVLRSPSEVPEVDLIAHDSFESLLDGHEELLEQRIPASTGKLSQRSTRQKVEQRASIQFPLGKRMAREETFSLSQVTDAAAFTAAASVHPGFLVPLLRQAVIAEWDQDGEVVTRIQPRNNGEAVERFVSVSEVRRAIEERVFSLVESSPTEVNAAKRIAEHFLRGTGVTADHEPWSERHQQHAVKAITRLINAARDARRPGSRWELKGVELPLDRQTEAPTHSKWAKKFVKGTGYGGWVKSIESAVRFDAGGTEFRLARLLDDAPSVVCWLRLDGRTAYIELEDGALYHPDFVVVDTDNVHWVVETKADRDANRPEVHARRQAAEEWATAVRDHAEFGVWRYLFVPEEVIKRALTWEELLAHAHPTP